MEPTEGCQLRWNTHKHSLSKVAYNLLETGGLVDCTLAAEGQYVSAHRLVLSACSPYFRSLLSQQQDKHPIIILKDVSFFELKLLIDYMYTGEVTTELKNVASFVNTALSLEVKGIGSEDDFPTDAASRTNSTIQDREKSIMEILKRAIFNQLPDTASVSDQIIDLEPQKPTSPSRKRRNKLARSEEQDALVEAVSSDSDMSPLKTRKVVSPTSENSTSSTSHVKVESFDNVDATVDLTEEDEYDDDDEGFVNMPVNVDIDDKKCIAICDTKEEPQQEEVDSTQQKRTPEKGIAAPIPRRRRGTQKSRENRRKKAVEHNEISNGDTINDASSATKNEENESSPTAANSKHRRLTRSSTRLSPSASSAQSVKALDTSEGSETPLDAIADENIGAIPLKKVNKRLRTKTAKSFLTGHEFECYMEEIFRIVLRSPISDDGESENNSTSKMNGHGDRITETNTVEGNVVDCCVIDECGDAEDSKMDIDNREDAVVQNNVDCKHETGEGETNVVVNGVCDHSAKSLGNGVAKKVITKKRKKRKNLWSRQVTPRRRKRTTSTKNAIVESSAETNETEEQE